MGVQLRPLARQRTPRPFSTQARPQSFIGRECNKSRMELLQCAPSNRAYKSEDRDVAAITTSSKTGRHSAARSATLSGGERRVSLPTGHHYASSTMGRTTTLRKWSTTLPPSAAMIKTERSPNPCLPRMRVELESPKLADYLERPRLVSGGVAQRNEVVAAAASAHHAKRYENNVPAYRNLRLGNFMEEQEEAEGDDIIPERFRQYYLDTYLNVCDTCDSLTHCNPLSPIHRGM